MTKFQLGIRNHMRKLQAKEHISAAASPVQPEKASIWRSRAKVVLAPVLPFFRALRRFLNAPVNDRLWVLEAQQASALSALSSTNQSIGLLQQCLDSLHAEVQRTREQLERQDARMGSLVGGYFAAFGDRFNEIEVKIRPLVELDTAYAIRLGDGYVLAPKDEPAFVLMLADATTGGLEPGTRKCVQRLLLPGMKAVDVGANIGLLTAACARSVGAGGKVYAFEPEDRMADLLERTLYMNGFSWVELRREAVGAEQGLASFHISRIPGHSSLYALSGEEDGGTKMVNVVRLDDAIATSEDIDLVKLDVEGAELDVLKGMKRLVTANKDIVVIAEYGPSHLARVGVSDVDWFAAFSNHGFKPYAIAEPTGTCEPTSLDKLANVESINIAFVRPGGHAEARLQPQAAAVST